MYPSEIFMRPPYFASQHITHRNFAVSMRNYRLPKRVKVYVKKERRKKLYVSLHVFSNMDSSMNSSVLSFTDQSLGRYGGDDRQLANHIVHVCDLRENHHHVASKIRQKSFLIAKYKTFNSVLNNPGRRENHNKVEMTSK